MRPTCDGLCQVSISSADGTGNLDIVLFTHVFDMFTSQVWDARNVIVLDARPGCPAGLPVPQLHCIGMHNFTLSGKTKYWEVRQWPEDQLVRSLQLVIP